MSGLRAISVIPGAAGLLGTKVKRQQAVDLMGLTFPNRVGLAAGFDKDARWVDELSTLGFGHIEIGTLTPEPQDGNPKPRLFRLPKDRALINRMGFNNGGVRDAVKRLSRRRSDVIVGGNIGKNKTTLNIDAAQDYLKCFQELHTEVDYFVVNVSSPNTPGLRQLQEKAPLLEILNLLQEENMRMMRRKPILLKIAPDLSNDQLMDICDLVVESGIAGVIATNTTISRFRLRSDRHMLKHIGDGGLSGAPLLERSNEVIAFLRERLPRPTVIVGVGGVMSERDALEKLNAGADLVQIYTGFIYEGPGLPGRIANATSEWNALS
jgi:dihydroorotate dehydrogenase